MTGVLNAVVAIPVSKRYSVTVGNSLSSYGYNDGTPFGSMSPDATFFGQTIRQVSSSTQEFSIEDMSITMQGSLPQNFFSILQVQDSAGAIRRYLSSAATTFSVFGVEPNLQTFWEWDSDNAAWTATGTRELILFK